MWEPMNFIVLFLHFGVLLYRINIIIWTTMRFRAFLIKNGVNKRVGVDFE